jgi:hypothetical protein
MFSCDEIYKINIVVLVILIAQLNSTKYIHITQNMVGAISRTLSSL